MPCFRERQEGDVVEGGEDGGGAKMDGGCSTFAMRSDRSATGERQRASDALLRPFGASGHSALMRISARAALPPSVPPLDPI